MPEVGEDRPVRSGNQRRRTDWRGRAGTREPPACRWEVSGYILAGQYEGVATPVDADRPSNAVRSVPVLCQHARHVPAPDRRAKCILILRVWGLGLKCEPVDGVRHQLSLVNLRNRIAIEDDCSRQWVGMWSRLVMWEVCGVDERGSRASRVDVPRRPTHGIAQARNGVPRQACT